MERRDREKRENEPKCLWQEWGYIYRPKHPCYNSLSKLKEKCKKKMKIGWQHDGGFVYVSILQQFPMERKSPPTKCGKPSQITFSHQLGLSQIRKECRVWINNWVIG